jgi:hypothetical protein
MKFLIQNQRKIRFLFGNTPKNEPEKRPKFHDFADGFFSALESNSKNKKFSTLVLYDGPLNTAFITHSKQVKFFSSIIWTTSSYLIYTYVYSYLGKEKKICKIFYLIFFVLGYFF